MDGVSTHLVFVVVSASALAFLLIMRRRLRLNYPDDRSPQMQSMRGFIRGMAIFAALVLILVLGDLLRIIVM